jgi:uncharacterized protein YggE
MPPNESTPSPKHKMSLSFDLRIVVVVLLLVIITMGALWKPWNGKTSDDRTVSVTGEATITAEPDEYLFYPNYRFKGTDKDAALADLTKKSDTIVGELKKLGVADSKIKTNSSGYGDYYSYSREPGTNESTYTLTLTVTVDNRTLAQKVQDYLLTTSPLGSVSPQPTFSDAKRKQLQTKARDAATKDARAKADQSAKNLGSKLGKVKQVSDGTGFDDIYYGTDSGGALSISESSDKRQLAIQPGENDLNYTVKVVYYLR